MNHLEEIAKIPGAIVTRDKYGNIISVEHKTPDHPVEVDPLLEKPETPNFINIVCARSHGKTDELSKRIAQELAEKIPAGHEIQDIEIDPFSPPGATTVIVKTGRGGARKGAGRKPDPDKRTLLSCRVAQPTLQLLKETAEETGQGIGAVLDFIVEDYKRRVEAE